MPECERRRGERSWIFGLLPATLCPPDSPVLTEQEIAAVLQQSFWECPQSDPAFREVLRMSRVLECPVDHVFFRAREEVRNIHVICSGTVTLSQSNRSGHTHVVRVMRERGVFGEAAVLGQFPAPVTAQASTATTALAIDGMGIRQLVERDHGACLQLLRAITRRVNFLLHHMEESHFSDARTRVAKFFVEQTNACGRLDFDLNFSKRKLAQQLNLRSETLSRVLRELSTRGFIHVQGCHFEVRDLAMIQKLITDA